MNLAMIIENRIYHGIVVAMAGNDDDGDGRICIEERMPPNHSTLPTFVSSKQRYTEKNCRDIFRSLANCLSILHAANIAHRNLHIENATISPQVRFNL